MANDILKLAIPYLELMKARKAGMQAPMSQTLSEEEKQGLVPTPAPETDTYTLSDSATPEDSATWESYKATAKPQQSVEEQLKPLLPPPKQPSIMDLIPKTMSAPAPQAVTDQTAPAPTTDLAPQQASVLDFGTNSVANQQGLAEAQNRQNDLQFLANMNRAFGQIGSGLAQSGPADTSIADSLERQGKQQIDNFNQKVDFQKNDPNSAYSKGLKDYFKNKLKMEIRGGASAAELEKIMPLAVREFEAGLDRERLKTQRAEDLAYKKDKDKEDRQLKRDLLGDKTAKEEKKADAKADDKTNNDFMKMAEKLSGAKASSRSAFGKAALNKAAAERIETLVEGRDLNSLDVRELQEVARSMDALLAQGQPTISGTHELVPKTARGDAGKLYEYIFNQRQGAQAGSFLKQMIKTVAREKELAQKQMESYKKELVPGYEHLEKKDPERFNRVLGVDAASQQDTGSKKVIKKGYNSKTNQTQFIYSDGSKEIVNGQR